MHIQGMTMDTIDPDKLYWARGNYLEFVLPGEAVLDICQAGSNDAAVEYWAPRIRRYPFGSDYCWAPTPESVRKELSEYGAWSDDELANDSKNWERLVWLMAWDICDDLREL